MYRKEIWGSAFLLLIFCGAFAMTFSMSAKCSTYPTMVTIAGMVLTAANLARALYKQKNKLPLNAPSAMTTKQILSAVITLAAAFAYIVLVRIIGYATITFLFTTVFSYYLSTSSGKFSKRWTYPVVGLATTLVLYFAFGTFLHVPLPKGILI